MADPRGKVVLGPLYKQIETQTRKMFGAGERNGDNKEGIGMDGMDMMNDMPLVSVLMFQQNTLTMPPEEMVDGLLREVHDMSR
jgi:beta-glucosidase